MQSFKCAETPDELPGRLEPCYWLGVLDGGVGGLRLNGLGMPAPPIPWPAFPPIPGGL